MSRNKKKIDEVIAQLEKAMPEMEKLEKLVNDLYDEDEIEESYEVAEGAPSEISSLSASITDTIEALKNDVKY